MEKEDFGIIAIAMLFVGFTQLFLDMGISAGIIHRQNITNKEYSSLFWLNIFVGTFLTLILYILSPFLTAGYNSKELTEIVQMLCFSILINALGTQQRTYCQKKLYFKRIALLEISSAITTFTVAILTAYYGFGAYSLAYSTLAGAIVFNVCHFIIGLIKDSRLSFHFNLNETKPFLKIGMQYILLKLTAAICYGFGTKKVVDVIQNFTVAMGLVLAMTGTVCLLQLISTVCFMKGVV